MHAYGILGRYLPEFGRITGLMQFDLFHAYTVDEHLLRTVAHLRRFGRPDLRAELPHCSDVFETLPKPELLHLAGLFHDIAKGRGSDHSEDGERDAAAFCERHGISRFDAGLVGWLVRHHLTMSMTAQREDISDPAVVRRFANLVGDGVRLDYLYLLTVADMRATNPNLWTDWKDTLLRDLYQATHRVLLHDVDGRQPAAAELARECRDEAQRQLGESGPATSLLQDLWETLEPDYFVLTPPEAVAWHAAEVLGKNSAPLVAVRTHRKRTEVFFHVPDRDHLFAAATTLLERADLTVVDARVFTTGNGMSFDSFTVAEPTGEPIEEPRRGDEILRLLARGLEEPEKAAYPTNRLPRRQVKIFHIPVRVTFDDRPANGRTVMEVVCADRPGVLSRIGWALAGAGASVHGAKIATFGEPPRTSSGLPTVREGRSTPGNGSVFARTSGAPSAHATGRDSRPPLAAGDWREEGHLVAVHDAVIALGVLEVDGGQQVPDEGLGAADPLPHFLDGRRKGGKQAVLAAPHPFPEAREVLHRDRHRGVTIAPGPRPDNSGPNPSDCGKSGLQSGSTVAGRSPPHVVFGHRLLERPPGERDDEREGEAEHPLDDAKARLDVGQAGLDVAYVAVVLGDRFRCLAGLALVSPRADEGVVNLAVHRAHGRLRRTAPERYITRPLPAMIDSRAWRKCRSHR